MKRDELGYNMGGIWPLADHEIISNESTGRKLLYPRGDIFQAKREQNSREIFILKFWPPGQPLATFQQLQSQ